MTRAHHEPKRLDRLAYERRERGAGKGHRGAEAQVVGAEPRPERGVDKNVGAGPASGLQAYVLGDQRVGEDGKVLAVLLQRADGDEADRARASALDRLDPSQLRQPVLHQRASANSAVTGSSPIAWRLCSVPGGRNTTSPGRASRLRPVPVRLTESEPAST